MGADLNSTTLTKCSSVLPLCALRRPRTVNIAFSKAAQHFTENNREEGDPCEEDTNVFSARFDRLLKLVWRMWWANLPTGPVNKVRPAWRCLCCIFPLSSTEGRSSPLPSFFERGAHWIQQSSSAAQGYTSAQEHAAHFISFLPFFKLWPSPAAYIYGCVYTT